MIRGLERGQKPALIISECQRAMVDRSIEDRELARMVERRGVLPRIARLADAFRAAGAPVFHCTLVPSAGYADFVVNCSLWGSLRKKGLLYAGSPGAEIAPEVAPKPGDIVSERRNGLTGFHATELERSLRAQGVTTVVLSGVSMNVALFGLAIEAVNRLFEVVLAEDCAAGATEESHVFQRDMHLRLLAAVATGTEIAEQVAARSWLHADR